MERYTAVVGFELKDGRELECMTTVCEYPATLSGHPDNWEPGWAEKGDSSFYLDGYPIEIGRMPKGLAQVAEAMKDSWEDDSRFTYERFTH